MRRWSESSNKCSWCKEPCNRIGTWRTAKGEYRTGSIHRECEPQNRDKDREDWT